MKEKTLNKAMEEQARLNYNKGVIYNNRDKLSKGAKISELMERAHSAESRNNYKSVSTKEISNSVYEAYNLNIQEHQDRIKKLIEDRNSTITQINKNYSLDDIDTYSDNGK